MNTKIDFRTILKDKELKSTHQRLAILDNIQYSKHIDIDKLYTLLANSYPTLSKATLYRNINELVSKGIITQLKIPNQKDIYEITKEPHIHLVCKKCNSIEDQIIDTDKFISTIAKSTDFNIETSYISIGGICQKCKSQMENY